MTPIFVWQGFDHSWQREVLGFRLAHRLSSLVNYIDRTDGQVSAVSGASPGVDGNYMEPRTDYRRVECTQLRVRSELVRLRGSDELDEVRKEASLELSTSLEVGVDEQQAVEAILAGIDLQWSCDPAKQPRGWPGNSNGVWPVELSVCLGAPERTDSTCRWTIRLRVVRGWTPMHGGIPLLAEKRLNHTMDLDASVHLQLLEGKELSAERGPTLSMVGNLRDSAPLRAPLSRSAQLVGMAGFGFAIPAEATRGPKRHRGRYLSAVGFGIDAEGAWARVAAPVTVVPAPITTFVDPVYVSLGTEAKVSVPMSASGQIRCNSSEEAPFFSAYRRFPETQTKSRVRLD